MCDALPRAESNVQAARSGVQTIAEGSVVSGTSKKMEMKLTNVARTSLEELRRDYEDFLRQRGLPLWPRDDPRHQLQGAGLWRVILTALNMDALVAL
jgi:hypothetical protein